MSSVPPRIRALNVPLARLPRGLGRWRLGSANAVEDAVCQRAGAGAALSPAQRAGLEALLDSYRRSARLHPLGEIMAGVNLMGRMVQTLRLADRRRRGLEPQRPIVAPVIITGLPRTGSTLLHNLLARDPQFRVPQSWEVEYPTSARRPPHQRWLTRRRTGLRFALIEALHPGFQRIHELAVREPQECIVMTAGALRSHLFLAASWVPEYQEWLDDQPPALLYDEHRAFLQHLQGGETVRWLLKAPAHLLSLPGLLSAYPDGHLIVTERDPAEVLPSIASLHWHLYRTFSDFDDLPLLGRTLLRLWSDARNGLLERLAADAALRARTRQVTYVDFTRDPLGCVSEIYRTLGLTLSTEVATAMGDYLRRRPQHRFGVHRYALSDYGLTPSELTRAFHT